MNPEPLSKNEQALLDAVRSKPGISTEGLSALLNRSHAAVRAQLLILENEGFVERRKVAAGEFWSRK